MKKHPLALIFDLDDTLLMDEAISQGVLVDIAKSIGVLSPLEGDAFSNKVRAIAKRRWNEGPCYSFCQNIGISSLECLWGNFFGESAEWCALRAWALEYRRQVFQEVLQGMAVDKSAEECAAWFVRERRARQALFPQALLLLEQLAPQYRLGLLTNGAPDLQREKLKASGLERFFHTVIISGEHGVGKPKPAIFEKMLQQLGVNASEAIMIGNSLERDIAGAAAAGIPSVWIQLPHATERVSSELQPDFTITELAQLLPLLEK